MECNVSEVLEFCEANLLVEDSKKKMRSRKFFLVDDHLVQARRERKRLNFLQNCKRYTEASPTS